MNFHPSRTLVWCAAGLLLAAGGVAIFQGLEKQEPDFPTLGKSGAEFFPWPQGGGSGRQWLEKSTVAVPGGQVLVGSRESGGPHRASMTPFRMGCCEVTTDEYAIFLGETGVVEGLPPQFELRGGRVAPRRGERRRPVAHVSYDDAAEYGRWLSAKCGVTVRLPTEDEWEWAARGGVVGARYPWGWGAPEGKACFRARRSARVGKFEPNGFGLYDVAGNVFEWCVTSNGAAVVRGGSWAEKNESALHVFRSVTLPGGYRGADVGFRIVQDSGG